MISDNGFENYTSILRIPVVQQLKCMFKCSVQYFACLSYNYITTSIKSTHLPYTFSNLNDTNLLNPSILKVSPAPAEVVAVDNVTLDDNKYKISNYYNLTIKNIGVDDDSIYTCSMGVEEYEAKLTVSGRMQMDARALYLYRLIAFAKFFASN